MLAPGRFAGEHAEPAGPDHLADGLAALRSEEVPQHRDHVTAGRRVALEDDGAAITETVHEPVQATAGKRLRRGMREPQHVGRLRPTRA